MPAKDLGAKHLCFKCSTRFYDLKKPVAICPKCGADQREAPVVKPPPAEKRSRASKVVEPVIDEVEVPETDEDAEVDEDADAEEGAASDDEG
jgi:uncharacterized protein (TIGR02300 family)